MEFDRMLAELFGEEDRARAMAARLIQIAQTSAAAAAGERDSLMAFLSGPMERHMEYEERAIFPLLAVRGLGPETDVAKKQHATLRELRTKLANHRPDQSVAGLVCDVARLMLHHTNFEGDYIYPELTHEEWRELMRAVA